MWKRLVFFIGMLSLIAACEPYAYNPTAVSVVITNVPTNTPFPTDTPTPTSTPTPTATPTPPPSPTPFPCNEVEGQWLDIDDNRSDVGQGENLRYRVYVPPCGLTSLKRFPVVYLIHGLGYREEQWEDLGIDTALEQGIRLGVLPPMMIVTPFMGQLGQRNRFPPDNSYETFILDELMPAVERDFCTIENPAFRGIGGISRGGFWAFSIAMRHPDIFGAVGGHSAYFPNNTSEIPPSFNPLELALNSSFLQDADLRIYLDNGVADSSGPSQQLFSSRLISRDIPHTHEVHVVGEHNNEYWSAHVSEYLSFYGRDWERDYAQLPDCALPSP